MIRISILIAFALTLVNCSEKTGFSYARMTGEAFGTTYNITMRSDSTNVEQRQIDSLIITLNKSLSTYDPNSLISRINRDESDVVIDQYFYEIFQKSGRIHSDSEGAFDPTIGILVNAWGFGPEEGIPDMDQKKVDSLMQTVGYGRLQLSRGKLIKPHPNTYLDYNANAKGYGVDIICRFLDSKNVKDYLVEIGGEIRARGLNDKRLPWKVAIEEPNFDGTRSVQTVINLENEVIATSGNYRKFKVDSITGEKYAHTIDTKTGYPSKTDLLSVSVIGKMDCTDADGYATAFMAMGFMHTKVFLQNHKRMKAYLIYSDEQGQIKTYKTDNLELASN
ncbi:MAG: FAD:protein FMN transferase [Lutimonas sp.]